MNSGDALAHSGIAATMVRHGLFRMISYTAHQTIFLDWPLPDIKRIEHMSMRVGSSLRVPTLQRALGPWAITHRFPLASYRLASSLPSDARRKLYPEHVPLSIPQRLLMLVGSAGMSLANPYRADMIAALTEVSAVPYFLPRLHEIMLSHPTGRQILRERPRMTSTTLDVDALRRLPEGTVGRAYASWLDYEGVSPDTRDPTRYIDDEEMAYVVQRYREAHDFYHAILGMPTNLMGEIAVKWFEWCNMGLPVAALSALFAPLRLSSARRRILVTEYIPWAIRAGRRCESMINVYWEHELETPVEELRKRIGLEPPPGTIRRRRPRKPTE